MSDLLKLSTAIPGDSDINGLDALAAALVDDPSLVEDDEAEGGDDDE